MIVVDDTKAKHKKLKFHKKHKLHPYVLDKDLNNSEYKPYLFNHHTTGYNKKVIVKNANRAMKKAVRQQIKRQIQQEIQNS